MASQEVVVSRSTSMSALGLKCPMMVLAGNSHPVLAQQIADRLGIKLGDMRVYHKTDRVETSSKDFSLGGQGPWSKKETNVEIRESVRGKDVYIIQTGTKEVNNDIWELMIIAYACKTSCARNIVGVLPYLPYSQQCKMRKRGSIACKLLATMLSRSGLTHIITMDLHQKEIQGFFNVPVDNLRASPFLIQYIVESIPDYRNAVMVSRNPNSVKRVTSYAERLGLGIAVIHGEEKIIEGSLEDGRNSPPLPSQDRGRNTHGLEYLPMLAAKEKPPLNVVGDVGGRIAIIVDDIVDDVKSFVKIAEALKARGAYKIYVMATHGILSSDAPRLIDDSPIDEVVVTNTVPHDIQKLQCHKIKTVDVSMMLVEAIRRIHYGESMSYLFKNIGYED